MDPSKDYYLVMEVHPKASPEMIERAKRVLLLRYHPDHNPGREEWAAEQTRLVLEAYEVLSNPETRRAYDEAVRRRQEPPPSEQTTAERPRTARRPAPERPEPAARPKSTRRPQRASPPRGRRRATTAPFRRKPAPPVDLPDGARLVSCVHCGRPSRVPRGMELHQVICGACGEPLRLAFRERMRRRLRRLDDRLERWRGALLRMLGFSSRADDEKENSS